MKNFLILFLLFSAYAQASLNAGNAIAIQGVLVDPTPPTSNQCLKYDATSNTYIPSSCSGGGGGGVDTMGTFGSSPNNNAGSISSTTLTLQPADATHPGGVSTGTQTLAGAKTFSSAPALSSLTASTVPYLDGSKIFVSSAVTPTELGYVAGVTSSIQTQLGTKAPSTTPTFATSVSASYATASTAAAFNASKQLISSATTSTELGFVSGVTSAIQTQINAKAPTATPSFTGVVSGIVEEFTGHILAPAAYTYVIDQSAAYAYTINSYIAQTSAGTITCAIQIGGVSVTGISAASLSSSPSTSNASAANSVVIGNRVTMVCSSVSSAADLSFTLKVTR